MIAADHVQAAADLLWDHWHHGRRMAALPADVRPRTRADGYAIQACFERLSDLPLFGWKIAATSAAGQAHLAVDSPLAGRLLGERALAVDAVVPFGNNHMRVAEAEFAFRMGRDLPPRDGGYDVEAVLGAVDTLHPAIEIPDSRYDDFTAVGAAQLIADNACAHYFVLGPAAPASWRDVDLAAHLVAGTVADKATHDGRGANVLGDPRVALTWLVNELSRHGITLRAGLVVTTGTCVTPLPIAPGDRVAADFGSLGRVSLHLADA